jgi:hypothetical protein
VTRAASRGSVTMTSRPTRPCTRQGAEVWPPSFVGGQSLRRALQVKPGVEQRAIRLVKVRPNITLQLHRNGLTSAEVNESPPLKGITRGGDCSGNSPRCTRGQYAVREPNLPRNAGYRGDSGSPHS